jgi:guanylate kinase
MRPLFHCFLFLSLAPVFVSCFSPEEMKQRARKSRASHFEKQDQRRMRAYEREDRYEAWVDRVFD